MILAKNHLLTKAATVQLVRLKRAGLTALGIAVIAILIEVIPGLSEWLQWERGGHILSGFTGHLTHWSWDHLIWDVTAFLALSFAALRILPERFFPLPASDGDRRSG